MVEYLHDFEIEDPNSAENQLARRIIEQLKAENNTTQDRASKLVDQEIKKLGRMQENDFYFAVRGKVMQEILYEIPNRPQADLPLSATASEPKPISSSDALARWDEKREADEEERSKL